MRSMFLMLSLLLPVTLLGSSASLAQSKLDASILSYDGKDFVRTETTLMNNGQSAVNTKLDANSPAYLKWVSLLPVLQGPPTRCPPATMTIQQPPILVGPCFDAFVLKFASLGASVNSFYCPRLLGVTSS